MLTYRQKEIMDLVVEGYSPQGIMEKLCISRSCVNCHMVNIYKKLGINTEIGKDKKMLAAKKYLHEAEKAKNEILKGQYQSLLDRYNSLLQEISFTD